jgi:hypothetical protein
MTMTREEQKTNAAIEMYPAGTQNSLQFRVGFATGVEWADQHPRKGLWNAEKVCNILRNKMDSNWFYEKMERADYNSIIEDLRKAMED